MKITTKGRYAIHILYDLAVNGTEHPVSVKEMATRQEISVKYTEQIISILNKAGYVSSSRGFQGGYRLTKPLDEYGIARAGRVSCERRESLPQTAEMRDDHALGKSR